MVKIDSQKCTLCGLCVSECPKEALAISDGKVNFSSDICFYCSHCFAVCPSDAISIDNLDNSEIVKISDCNRIGGDDLLNFMKTRRSVRKFTDEEVSDEDIAKLIDAGRYAPTASNVQDVKFIVYKDKVKELAGNAIEVLYRLAADENSFLSPGMRKLYEEQLKLMYNEYKEKGSDLLFYDAKAVILVLAKNPTNGAIAASYIELLANAMGLGACYIGFESLAAMTEEHRSFLGFGPKDKLITCIAVGHPAVKYTKAALKKEAVCEKR